MEPMNVWLPSAFPIPTCAHSAQESSRVPEEYGTASSAACALMPLVFQIFEQAG